MSKNIVVTGATGMVGSHLIDLLLDDGHRVHGLVRKCSTFPTERIEHRMGDERLQLHYGDVTDGLAMRRLFEAVEPHEIYHLAALSHVQVSFEMPVHTAMATGVGTAVVLEAARDVCPGAGIYNAATSELFGNEPPPCDELSPMQPRSPYACAKLYAYQMARVYRDAYGMYVANGILFNQTSERQSPTFITRKITRGVARIVAGLDDELVLGNLESRRDLTHAADGARAIQMILQASEPDDWVVASGESQSIRGILAEAVCAATGWDDPEPWIDEHVVQSADYHRPLEVHELLGDPTRIKYALGWDPKYAFSDIISNMVNHDLERAGAPPAPFRG